MSSHREAVSHDAAQRLASALERLLSTLVGRALVTFQEARPPETLAALTGPLAVLTFCLNRGANGPAAFVLPGPAGLALARLLLGEDASMKPDMPGPEEEDAFRELANQVAGAMATAMGGLLGTPVGFETPGAQWIPVGPHPPLAEGFIRSGMAVGASADSVVLVMGISAGAVVGDAFLVVPRAALPPPPASPLEAALPSLGESAGRRNGNAIEMLMDISLQVTVELGRTRMIIRDILHLAPGSILELDKLAGEPVDIMINDKSIARGEVVVVDENFGVRLTSIVTPSERVMNLR